MFVGFLDMISRDVQTFSILIVSKAQQQMEEVCIERYGGNLCFIYPNKRGYIGQVESTYKNVDLRKLFFFIKITYPPFLTDTISAFK